MTTQSKTALITGASRGIGQAIALQLAKNGYHVVGTATRLENMNATVTQAQEQGLSITPIALNVTDARECEAVIQSIEKNHPVSILVNNAGITRDGLMLRMKDDDVEAVLQTNLVAVFRLSRLVLRQMVKARFGRIINISSVVGASGNPGQANYCAAKAGLGGFARSLAQEVGNRGITVNCVAPGFIATDMTDALGETQKTALLDKIPAGRLGTPEDIATLVAFLAGDSAGYINGETIHVNGGMYMAA